MVAKQLCDTAALQLGVQLRGVVLELTAPRRCYVVALWIRGTTPQRGNWLPLPGVQVRKQLCVTAMWRGPRKNIQIN